MSVIEKKDIYILIDKEYHLIQQQDDRIKIPNIFCIGRRCNSTELIRYYNLEDESGPFDWLIIDFESSIDLISNSFRDYFNNVTFICKDKNIYEIHNKSELFNENNYTKLCTFIKNNDIRYVGLN